MTAYSDGRSSVTDRRVVELQPDGSRLIRDPVTKQGFDLSTGQPRFPNVTLNPLLQSKNHAKNNHHPDPHPYSQR